MACEVPLGALSNLMHVIADGKSVPLSRMLVVVTSLPREVRLARPVSPGAQLRIGLQSSFCECVLTQ